MAIPGQRIRDRGTAPRGNVPYNRDTMLRTFGRVQLGDGSFTRPKPLLLLAYLTVEGPCPRRRLADLFWPSAPATPDSPERDDAVASLRQLIGATNPAEAAEGTIRKLYAKDIGENAIHGSDSDENALIEGAFHFSGREIY